MSRPKKAIVDYFPHFINHKKTIAVLENQFKNDGYAFWFKLLEILGGSNHHFIDCNEPTQWLFLLTKTLVSEETAINILNLLAEMNAIDKEFWKKKIIRSQNFIDNLLPVYQRREINVYTKDELKRFLLTKTPFNEVVDSKKPQRKGEERKGEERKEDKEVNKTKKFHKPCIENLTMYFQEKGFMGGKGKYQAEKFFDWYQSNGWKVGKAKNSMKDWKATVRTWIRNIEDKDTGRREDNIPEVNY